MKSCNSSESNLTGFSSAWAPSVDRIENWEHRPRGQLGMLLLVRCIGNRVLSLRESYKNSHTNIIQQIQSHKYGHTNTLLEIHHTNHTNTSISGGQIDTGWAKLAWVAPASSENVFVQILSICGVFFTFSTPGDQLISCDATTMVVRILLSPSLPRYMHTGLVLPFSECLMRPGSLSFD